MNDDMNANTKIDTNPNLNTTTLILSHIYE